MSALRVQSRVFVKLKIVKFEKNRNLGRLDSSGLGKLSGFILWTEIN